MRCIAPLSIAVVLGLSAFGCKKEQDDPTVQRRKVTAESTYDATETIEHEGYRFRLALPGPSWKLLRKQDIRRMVPDAVAGAASREGLFGSVIIERLPGVELAKAVDMVNGQLPGSVMESQEEITFEGQTALRTNFTAVVEGTDFRYQRIAFIREGYFHQLLAWGVSSTTSKSDLDPFFSAVELTEGALTGGDDVAEVVTEADGVTWQIRGGRFRSAVSGVELSATGHWQFVVGQQLEQTNADAELALQDVVSGAYFAVISERYEGDDPSRLVGPIEAAAAARLGTRTPEKTRVVAGQPVQFFRQDPDSGMEVLLGVRVADGAVSQLMTWYPKPLRDTAVVAFEELLAGLTVMSEAQRLSLRETLVARKGVQWKVSKHTAFVGEEFRDYQHQAVWAQPPGLFTVSIGDSAKAGADKAVLSIQAPLQALYGNLEVIPGGEDDVAQ
ncbi:MAG: hypothetical protein K0V04_30110, partial [Deltaproteobacteria bacterium]|nr:hypothetical protein [Deltaproteobacteria bacterium]